MNNKYYDQIKLQIQNNINENNYERALNLINKELSMPYIPMAFEEFLLNSLNKIPLKDDGQEYSLTVNKLIDLLIRLDNDKNDYKELISQLNKFNLNLFKDEINYLFENIKSQRNKALIFDILCQQKLDLELEFGNPKNYINYESEEDYLKDREHLRYQLQQFPSLINPGVKLLKEIYLTKYLGQSLESNYSDIVLYALYKLFDEKSLISSISNIEEVAKKLERFNSIENL